MTLLFDTFFCAFANACIMITFYHYSQEGMILSWYIKLIEKFPIWLYKPLGGCIYCFSFWVSTIIFYVLTNSFADDYNIVIFVIWHSAYVSLTNVFTHILKFYFYD